MKKALIVKYTENNVEYWGYYYKRYFNATYFETSLELKFYLKDLEIEYPPHQLQNCTRFPFENFFEFFGTKSST